VNPITTSVSATAGSAYTLSTAYDSGTAYGSGSGIPGASAAGSTVGGSSLGLSQMKQARASLQLDGTPDRYSSAATSTGTGTGTGTGAGSGAGGLSSAGGSTSGGRSQFSQRGARSSGPGRPRQGVRRSALLQRRAVTVTVSGPVTVSVAVPVRAGSHTGTAAGAGRGPWYARCFGPRALGGGWIQSRYADSEQPRRRGRGGGHRGVSGRPGLPGARHAGPYSRPKTRGLAGQRGQAAACRTHTLATTTQKCPRGRGGERGRGRGRGR